MKSTTRRRRIHVSWDDLELLCFTNPGSAIEVDEANGVGILALPKPRREYIADLPNEEGKS